MSQLEFLIVGVSMLIALVLAKALLPCLAGAAECPNRHRGPASSRNEPVIHLEGL